MRLAWCKVMFDVVLDFVQPSLVQDKRTDKRTPAIPTEAQPSLLFYVQAHAKPAQPSSSQQGLPAVAATGGRRKSNIAEAFRIHRKTKMYIHVGYFGEQ